MGICARESFQDLDNKLMKTPKSVESCTFSLSGSPYLKREDRCKNNEKRKDRKIKEKERGWRGKRREGKGKGRIKFMFFSGC